MTTGTARLTDAATGLSGTRSASFTVRALPVFGIPDPVPFPAEGGWAAMEASLGTLKALRGYNAPSVTGTSGVPASWPGSQVSFISPHVSIPVISFKPAVAAVLAGTLDGALAAWFAKAPPGAMVSAWHEGERSAATTPASLIALHRRIYAIFKAHAPAGASYGQILETYTNYPGSQFYPLAKWVCGAASGGVNLDWYGLDAYPATTADTWATTGPPAAAAVRSVVPGAVIAITEANNSANFTAAAAAVVSFYQDAWAWAKADGCPVFLPYWGNPSSTWPPPASVISALAAINMASRG